MGMKVTNMIEGLEDTISRLVQKDDYKEGCTQVENLFNNGEYFLDLFVVPDSKFIASFTLEKDSEFILSYEAYTVPDIYKAFVLTYAEYIKRI